MGAPFYAEYIQTFTSKKDYQDVLCQFEISYQRLFDSKTNLLFHAWDEKRSNLGRIQKLDYLIIFGAAQLVGI